MSSDTLSSNQAGTTLHFVVTCMGRLDMIRQSIDRAIAQPSSTYTLVDYSCPQHTGQWVRDRYPQAHVVFAEGRTSWHASEAHNLGARTIRDGWICFLDSDVLLPSDFSQRVLSTVKSGTYLTVESDNSSLYGLVVCSQEDFVRTGGYDEIIRDWGGEDIDFRRSLERIGVVMARLPGDIADFIPHDDSVRTQNCGIKDRYASNQANVFYSFVKDFLLTEGETPTTEQLRRFYCFGRDRLLKGMPWLSWPDGDIEPSDFPRLFHHVFATSEGYRSMEAETWGPIRLFRVLRCYGNSCGPGLRLAEAGGQAHRGVTPLRGGVERDGESITEMLSVHNSHRINLRVPGRTTLDVVSIYGDRTTVPVYDGECSVVIKAEPVFLPAGVDLIKDVSVLLAPAPGPALAVELSPGPEYDRQPVRLSVSLDGEAIEECEVSIGDRPKSLRIPMPSASPEQSRMVEAAVTVGARTQVATRRTTFLAAPPVTREEAMSPRFPDRIYRYILSEDPNVTLDPSSARERHQLDESAGAQLTNMTLDPASDNLHSGNEAGGPRGAEVAWGWTDTDLICWIARQDTPSVESKITVAIDAENVKSTHIDPLEIWARGNLRPAADGSAAGPAYKWRMDYQILFDVPSIPLDGSLSTELSGPCRHMVLRIPFDVIGISPTVGRTLGLALFIVDTDGQGATRSVAWGGGMGIGPDRNPRLYNEITLGE